MLPGPAIKGSAMGKTETSWRSSASSSSCSVVLLAPEERANTISIPIRRRIIPPAVRSDAREIPSVLSRASPRNANRSKTMVAITTARTAVRFLSFADMPFVSAAKIAEISIGLTVAKSVASVTAAISPIFHSFRNYDSDEA